MIIIVLLDVHLLLAEEYWIPLAVSKGWSRVYHITKTRVLYCVFSYHMSKMLIRFDNIWAMTLCQYIFLLHPRMSSISLIWPFFSTYIFFTKFLFKGIENKKGNYFSFSELHGLMLLGSWRFSSFQVSGFAIEANHSIWCW